MTRGDLTGSHTPPTLSIYWLGLSAHFTDFNNFSLIVRTSSLPWDQVGIKGAGSEAVKTNQGRLQKITIVRKDCDVSYPLHLIVPFGYSSRCPRLNHHSLTNGFRCTSTISRKVFVSSLKLWEPVFLVQKKKRNGLTISKHCYKDFDTDLCHTDAFDSWSYQSNYRYCVLPNLSSLL